MNQNSTYAGGSLDSRNGDVQVIADSKEKDKGNLHATGETIQGQNVTLQASKDIILDAGNNTQTTTENYSSKEASIGAIVGSGGFQSVDESFSQSKDNGTTRKTTHTGTTVIANNELTTKSGNDTNISGSQVEMNYSLKRLLN